MNTSPQPKGMTRTEILVALTCVALLGCIILPNLGHKHINTNLASCAANLKGVAGGMLTYAAENANLYPLLTPEKNYVNNPYAALNSGCTSAELALDELFKKPAPQVNRASQIFWINILRGSASPKLFVCRSDRQIRSSAPLTNEKGEYFLSFSPASLSYSIAYPWDKTGQRGAWWKDTGCSDLPIASDMAPALSSQSEIGINSSNHNEYGNGQNILYADGHVEFQRTPYAGQYWDRPGEKSQPDNIWTTQPQNRPLNPAKFVAPTADKAPFDTLMVPARNSNDGTF